MTANDTAILLLIAVAAPMVILGGWPTGPNWMRWAGLALATVALVALIATTPRGER